MKALRAFLLGLLFSFAATAVSAQSRDVVVFAAASLTDVLNEIGSAYTAETHVPVKFSFAASSTLARQIEAGAPVQIFFSADVEWMDFLESKDLIERSTRRNVVGNRLVLVAPVESKVVLRIAPHMPLLQALEGGRLATGDPDSVPVGKYAQSALMNLGVWNAVSTRLVRAENVRSALAFVARGEAALGIVYETDARIERRVRIIDVFPRTTHPAIVYPAAAVKGADAKSRAFLSFLASQRAQLLFKKYGFSSPTP
ncbi:MAG TPA: molybdate ABC transporter substrate-binding protein [Steroidobacteraceae bacterium]|nr:molybdate ABC transporter substrate-binding protein [Steroidobacteraceae bacterium]